MLLDGIGGLTPIGMWIPRQANRWTMLENKPLDMTRLENPFWLYVNGILIQHGCN